MRDRANLLLTVLFLIGSGCILGEFVARWAAWPLAANALAMIALTAMCSCVVGTFVQRAARTQPGRSNAAVSKDWLPEVVDIKFSTDLLPEFTRSQQEVVDACGAFRSQQGIQSPVIRLRDDALLASRSYTISINGVRISGATLGRSDDFPTQLLAALKDVWARHADAIRFFAELRAQAV